MSKLYNELEVTKSKGSLLKTPSGYRRIKEVYKPNWWQRVLSLTGVEIVKLKLN